MREHQSEVELGQCIQIGENWARFLDVLNEERIEIAEKSLQDILGVENLQAKTFLSAGAGLFSLAARRLGAKVHSFDFDPQSVACTAELKQRYFADDTQRAEEVFEFYRDHGFTLKKLKRCAGYLGCNEFVLEKS